MDITVTFVGNATTLIFAGGLTLLTDPNFLHRGHAELVAMLALPKVIPVHFDDYAVFASPLSDFTREMQHRGLGDRIVVLNRGATVTV
ncbi:hypothetical protein MMAN_29440 [Mycobacterium mantenii]|uniref:Metallo-beta-lactamase domain-containing protein n=1 Tax=Mycobacterium mantenii TaxID=560555 RepID=A0A1X0F7Y8_MYCNT|nr:hypothetical protein BST30_26395 [Mycobacterium mantenii]BBY38810.1 hypothetical protein MMAN_29440 [Mycobacterium mantenii]